MRKFLEEPDSTKRGSTMSKVDGQTLAQLKELFLEYEQEMRASRYSSNSISMRIKDVRDFMKWLEGTYSPKDYVGSQARE